MRNRCFWFVLFLFLVFAVEGIAQVVEIPDSMLRALIKEHLRKYGDVDITVEDMESLTILDNARYGSSDYLGISDLTGLEFAINLQELRIRSGNISDISPVAGLTKLRSLRFDYTYTVGNDGVEDISPVIGLTNLEILSFREHSVSDISPVAGLTQLRELYFHYNSIEDLSPVAGLTELTRLGFYRNVVENILPVVGLTKLEYLSFGDNLVEDISPVAGLTQLRELYFHYNSVEDISPVAGLTQLRYLGFEENLVVDISPVAGLTKLEYLSFEGNLVEDISLVLGLPDLDELYCSDNEIKNLDLLCEFLKLKEKDDIETDIDPICLPIFADLNWDGKVDYIDILILLEIAQTDSSFRRVELGDLDRDGRVDRDDLLLMIQVLDTRRVDAAPAAKGGLVNAAVLEGHLNWLRSQSDGYEEVIAWLEGVLTNLSPDETQLLRNYPNPFNPETWIPYNLAEATDVQLTIYDTNGAVVRRFDLGHQRAGYYTDRSKAVYWDGQNAIGESVASGVYFYHLSAGEYAKTRRMLILK